MSTFQPDFYEVMDLAFRLAPEEQSKLVSRLVENLADARSDKEASERASGSPASLYKAMREPPHLMDDDVDLLERAIASGRQPLRAEGPFDGIDDA